MEVRRGSGKEGGWWLLGGVAHGGEAKVCGTALGSWSAAQRGLLFSLPLHLLREGQALFSQGSPCCRPGSDTKSQKVMGQIIWEKGLLTVQNMSTGRGLM